MVSLEELYVIAVGILLLTSLGVSIPVLVQIVRDGRERRRERMSEDRNPDTEDGGDDRRSPTRQRNEMTGETQLTCRHCGAANDPQFTYCWRCVEQL